MITKSAADIALALLRAGVWPAHVARVSGVSLSTARRWSRLDRQGELGPRPLALSSTGCPNHDTVELDRRAYAYVLGLYLGDGHITQHRRGVLALSIYCDVKWQGLIGEVRASVRDVLPTVRSCVVERRGCVEVKTYSKHWICFFPQHGRGMKHTRTIELLAWQQEIVEEHNQAFLRGLFHSDGCRSDNRVRRQLTDGDRWYTYPRYFFSNKSANILRLCGEALDREGVAWRYNRSDCISVARRASVALMDTFIGPKY